MITMIVGDYNDGLNHQYKAMFKERRTRQGAARHSWCIDCLIQ